MEPEVSTSDLGSRKKTGRRKSLRFNRWNDRLDDSVGDTLEVFLNRGWEIFNCSPIFGFETTDVYLKKCCLILKHFCALMNVNVDEKVEYIVRINCIDNVGVHGNDGMIKVEVQSRKENNEDILIYLGFFMSWGTTRFTTGFIFLPLLVCKAKSIKVKRLIHAGFKKLFDCIIEPYILDEIQLMWLNSLFVSVSKDSQDQRRNVIRLTLLPTWTAEHKTELYVSLTDLRKIWARFHSQDNDKISIEETLGLYEGLLKTTSERVSINLGGLKLYEVKYPDITVNRSGKFFCKNVEIVNELFIFLCKEKPCINFLTGNYWDDTSEEESF